MTTPAPANQAPRRRKGRNEPSTPDAATPAELDSRDEAPAADDAHVSTIVDTAPAEPEAEAGNAAVAEDAPHVDVEAAAAAEKKRIHEQLEALKRREAELRRELAVADHPELKASLRAIERCAAAVSKVDAKIAEGPSKSEARRMETLDKLLESAIARRAELDAKIGEMQAERATLGDARTAAFREERRVVLTSLAASLVEHGPALAAAGLDLPTLLPGLAAWREDILALTTAPADVAG